MRERPMLFGADASLVGVVTEPSGEAEPRPSVVLLNAGVVHRVGPNRLHVKLARRLAADGHRVLRFDFSGVGDSRARGDSLPLERSAVLETREAVDLLRQRAPDDPVVLAAICSGAAFSVQAALADARVAGLILINPAGHRWGSEAELSRTMLRHYRRMATFGPSRGRRLRKLLTLDFDLRGALGTAGRRLRSLTSRSAPEPPAAPEHARALRTLVRRGVRILVLYSEADEGLDYHRLYLEPELGGVEEEPGFDVRVIGGANHTFTLLSHQRALLDEVRAWLGSGDGPGRRSRRAASPGAIDHPQEEPSHAP